MLMSSTSDRGGFAANMYNLSFSHVLFEDLDKAFHFKSSVYYETVHNFQSLHMLYRAFRVVVFVCYNRIDLY